MDKVDERTIDILQRMNIQFMREEVLLEVLRREEAVANVPEVLHLRNSISASRERILDLGRELVRIYGSQMYKSTEE